MAEIINSLWIGRPLALIEQLSIASFLQNGYEYHLYCYKKIAGVPKGVVIRDAAEILPASEIFSYPSGPGKGSVAAFANLFRYKLLLERGGWWMDTDMVCLRPMNFSEPVIFAGQRQREEIQVTNTVIKLPPGHAVARQCYEMAKREDREKLIWGKTGPLLIDHVVRENNLQSFIQSPEVFCPVDWWEWQSLISPKPLAQLITGETRAVHLWHELWRREGIKLDSATGEILPKNFFPKLWRALTGKSNSAQNGATPINELLRQFGLKK